jgi:nucleoside-diphosphate-sugar epimerase
MSKKVVLIAGCGQVGCHLAKQLIETGNYSVWGLRRTISKLPEGVNPIEGDLFHQDKLGSWPEQIDYLVYAASANIFDPSTYRLAYVQGIANVLDKLKKDGLKPKRILYTSSIDVYHQSNGEEVDETSATTPESPLGQAVLEGEQIFLNSSFPATIIRLGGIYGPGTHGSTFFIGQIKSGKCCPAEPVIYSNRIHIADCAGIVAYLIEKDEVGLPIEPIYIGVDNLPSPLYDLCHWIADQLEIVLDDSHPFPFSRGSKRCLNQLIRQAGYNFKFPDFKVGFAELL